MQDFEVIVVDDGSTDPGPEIVSSIGDNRISVLVRKNSGVSAARNAGIQAASADIVAFLDADDEWRPEFLATILRLRRNHQDCAVYATSYEICRAGMRRPALLRGLPKGFVEGVLEDYFVVASRSDPPLWTSAVAVDRNAIRNVGGFPVDIHSGEDLLTWAKLALKYQIAYSAEPLAIYWAPDGAASRPYRKPAVPDKVGSELARLIESHGPAQVKGMLDYLAMWHRIRGAAFLHFADSGQARPEFARALRFGCWNTSVAILWAVSALPNALARKTYLVLRRLASH
jgi:hypothetical protein